MKSALCGAYYVLGGTGGWSYSVPLHSMNQGQVERREGINLKAHQALGPGMADGWGRGRGGWSFFLFSFGCSRS